MIDKLHPAVHKVKFERTFCMIKPDGVRRGIMGDIIGRLERAGLKITAMQMKTPTREEAMRHYPMSDEAWVARLGDKSISGFDDLDATPEEVLGSGDRAVIGKDVAESLTAYLTSGPVVCMVVEGVQAIAMVRKLAGHTLPFKAEMGTIRGDYSVDSPAIANAEKRSVHNLFHASENAAEAYNEIKLWFKDAAIHTYDLTSEAVTYTKFY